MLERAVLAERTMLSHDDIVAVAGRGELALGGRRRYLADPSGRRRRRAVVSVASGSVTVVCTSATTAKEAVGWFLQLLLERRERQCAHEA